MRGSVLETKDGLARSEGTSLVCVGDALKLRFHMDGAIGAVQEYVLDHRQERDIRELVTPDSPAGRALLGHGSGEIVGYTVFGGSRYIEIEIIEIGSPRG